MLIKNLIKFNPKTSIIIMEILEAHHALKIF